MPVISKSLVNNTIFGNMPSNKDLFQAPRIQKVYSHADIVLI